MEDKLLSMFLIVLLLSFRWGYFTYFVKVMTSNAEWGIFDADIQMLMSWPKCYLLLNSQISLIVLHDFLLDLMLSPNVFPIMILMMMIVIKSDFSYLSLSTNVVLLDLMFPVDPPVSHVISHCLPCFSIVLPMFPPCWSWWWSWLNLVDDVLPLLSSARWWCFMSVSSLRSDYRGWLLIIFILNILLWWSLFLSF